MTSDLHNPFIASDNVNNKAGGEFDDFPLFDDDTSQPLEPFPRIMHDGKEGWEFFIRHPPKKKMTSQRYVTLCYSQKYLYGLYLTEQGDLKQKRTGGK